MIDWLTKTNGRGGRGTYSKKEIGISVSPSHTIKNGQQKWTANINFRNDAHKKATNNCFVAIGFDHETNRMYFASAKENEGYKISRNGNVLCSRVPAKDVEGWRKITGNYDLKKDVVSNTYYIDIATCPTI